MREGADGPGDSPTTGASLAHCLHKLCLTLLALLLPLAFLLLARLTASPVHLLPFLHADLLLLLSTLSGLCIATLWNTLLGGHRGATSPRTGLAWAFVWVLQLCVGLGVEAAIAAGVEPARAPRATWPQRAFFFLGVHEATLFWSRAFVRPVVDDAVFGAPSCEGRGDGVALGAAFGALWLWMLANEVDGLLPTLGLKGGPLHGGGWSGFACRMVSYVVATTGTVKVVKGFLWVAKLLLLCARGGEAGKQTEFSDSCKAGEV